MNAVSTHVRAPDGIRIHYTVDGPADRPAVVLTHFTLRSLGGIAVPTAVVTGADDALLHPSHSRVIAKRIPNARLEILPDVGHGIHSSDPDAVRRSLAWVRERAERAAI